MWRSLGPLNLPEWEKNILARWRTENTFQRSLEKRRHSPRFSFYEGPPSANGKPGIHHVFARTLKDLVCRYKTMRGYYVPRRAGWDTHGLPVELSVEKELGLTKADIGQRISIADYNRACREAVMRYKAAWDELTERMGYWVDLQNPYITFDPQYIESVWWLLKAFYDRGLLYRDYTIQPYSPAAGTAL
ncbi:MAG: isoleucine--tRNA ligase, partial [Bacteroidetes bacterium]